MTVSQDSGRAEPVADAPGQETTDAAQQCTEAHGRPENRGDSSPIEIPQTPAEVSGGAVKVSSGGRRSDKQNDKQNAKRASADPELAEVTADWSELPEAVKEGILATVRALTGRVRQ